MIDKNRKDDRWDEQKLHAEGIMVVVIGRLEAYIDQVQCCKRGSQEDHLKKKKELIEKKNI